LKSFTAAMIGNVFDLTFSIGARAAAHASTDEYVAQPAGGMPRGPVPYCANAACLLAAERQPGTERESGSAPELGSRRSGVIQYVVEYCII